MTERLAGESGFTGNGAQPAGLRTGPRWRRHGAQAGELMNGREVRSLTLDRLGDLPDPCRGCLFWERDPVHARRAQEQPHLRTPRNRRERLDHRWNASAGSGNNTELYRCAPSPGKLEAICGAGLEWSDHRI